jgi:hypothetical protein
MKIKNLKLCTIKNINKTLEYVKLYEKINLSLKLFTYIKNNQSVIIKSINNSYCDVFVPLLNKNGFISIKDIHI